MLARYIIQGDELKQGQEAVDCFYLVGSVEAAPGSVGFFDVTVKALMSSSKLIRPLGSCR